MNALEKFLRRTQVSTVRPDHSIAMSCACRLSVRSVAICSVSRYPSQQRIQFLSPVAAADAYRVAVSLSEWPKRLFEQRFNGLSRFLSGHVTDFVFFGHLTMRHFFPCKISAYFIHLYVRYFSRLEQGGEFSFYNCNLRRTMLRQRCRSLRRPPVRCRLSLLPGLSKTRCNRVGNEGLIPSLSSHTTRHTVPYQGGSML